MFRFVLTLVWYLAYFPSLITKIIQIYHVILKNATQNEAISPGYLQAGS